MKQAEEKAKRVSFKTPFFNDSDYKFANNNDFHFAQVSDTPCTDQWYANEFAWGMLIASTAGTCWAMLVSIPAAICWAIVAVEYITMQESMMIEWCNCMNSHYGGCAY